MACPLAQKRLKTMQEYARYIKYRICPICGRNLEVTTVHLDNGERDLKCNHCERTYKEVF